LGNYKANIEVLREALAGWSARHLRATGNDHAARRITIDIDSLPVQAYGSQAGVKYNGYYREGNCLFSPPDVFLNRKMW
jgi:hypothetical protein